MPRGPEYVQSNMFFFPTTAQLIWNIPYTQPNTGGNLLLLLIKNNSRNFAVSDSLGNVWKKAYSQNRNALYYVPSCKPGVNVVTIDYTGVDIAPPGVFIIAEYYGAVEIDKLASNGESIPGAVPNVLAESPQVTPSVDGELIISTGSNATFNQATITTNDGTTIRRDQDKFLADTVQQQAAPIKTSVTYNFPVVYDQQAIITFFPIFPTNLLNLVDVDVQADISVSFSGDCFVQGVSINSHGVNCQVLAPITNPHLIIAEVVILPL